jgi:hypothetical protein
MKTLHKLLLLLLVVLTFSCKKDATSKADSDSYVKIKKNGAWITYAGLGELGPDLGDASLTDLVVSGASADGKEVFNISIQMDGPDLTAGTYSSDVYTPYNVDVSLTTGGGSAPKDYDVEDALNKPSAKYIINITSITSTQISGTFTGNYLYDDFSSNDPDGGVIPITEGEFKVKRIR